ncbi:centromeric protein E [Nematocida homosporus]|uniref:centromeric protein E n=1 Tax=Nematocida homosporus TaxID=1912981 RepID=UPI0022202B1B|nr:centromeric protein E [Nematocida homosporus]KAI5186738.1 centromeric protein E [Nematocida homosporus]
MFESGRMKYGYKPAVATGNMQPNSRITVAVRARAQPIVGKKSECEGIDRVFSLETNREIYLELVKPYIARLEFSTIFTYGRTGSGKTYTMFGNSGDPGLAQLLLSDLVSMYKIVSVRCIEIYNEIVTDLITGEPVRIIQESSRTRVLSDNLTVIKSEPEINRLIQQIEQKRKTSQTEYNRESSRSHTVIEITSAGLCVNLVDLAGNEKISLCEQRRKEGLMINKSLLTLGKVIDQLNDSTQHVSYRESKLTRILQNTLTSGTIVCICTVIDMADQLTLKFAKRLKRIKGIERQLEKSKDEIIYDLQQQIQYLTEEILLLKTNATPAPDTISNPPNTDLAIEEVLSNEELGSNEEIGSNEEMGPNEEIVSNGEVPPTVDIIKQDPTFPNKSASFRGQSHPSLSPEHPEDSFSSLHTSSDYSDNVDILNSSQIEEPNPTQSSQHPSHANLYEMIYYYIKDEVTQEMANLLTPQEIDQVHVTVTKRRAGIRDGSEFKTIVKESRTEIKPYEPEPSTEY